uniref:ATP synthase subunit a n=1 Tax=Gonatocerus sp. ZCS-2018 TaxID=2305128 RepID=A0A346PZ40_9HYME|nr:ATP synthase F0 subunit 6 [Gonatocerus sp. ZCS-2018]
MSFSSNLFSIFDPMTSNYMSMNWISSMFPFLMVPLIFWLIPNRFLYIQMMLMMNLKNEFSLLLNSKINKFNLIILINLFYYIMMINYLGLYNYIFTSSSHLVFSMTFSLLLWLIIMIFGWLKNLNHMFIHLVPQGTPSVLMPFMVIIETISNIIRPITLAVRLSANMIAGHLLITLMSNNGFNMMILILILTLFMQNLLMLLEVAVSLIQAYVFSVLTLLYSTDSS